MRETVRLSAQPDALRDLDVLAPFALEHAPTPMVITDPRQPDNPIVLANAAFLDLCGYPAEEVIGRNCRFLQGPDSAPAAVATLRTAVATETSATVEILNYRRDGAAYWNRVHLSPVRDAEGRLVYFFAAQIDLSPQREAEALRRAENRLLREVDHRAMNALALVQAIVRLTEAEAVRSYSAAVQAGWARWPVRTNFSAPAAGWLRRRPPQGRALARLEKGKPRRESGCAAGLRAPWRATSPASSSRSACPSGRRGPGRPW